MTDSPPQRAERVRLAWLAGGMTRAEAIEAMRIACDTPGLTDAQLATLLDDPLPIDRRHQWFRRYNERPQDTAVGRAELARMVADTDAAAWGEVA